MDVSTGTARTLRQPRHSASFGSEPQKSRFYPLIKVEPELHEDASNFIKNAPGIIPVFGFDLERCDPATDEGSCNPRTYSHHNPLTGQNVSTPMLMPVANWKLFVLPKLWAIAVHELGHSLGLDHDDPDGEKEWSMMLPTIDLSNPINPELTDADVKRVRGMYCPHVPR